MPPKKDKLKKTTDGLTKKKKGQHSKRFLFDFLPAHSKHIAPALRDSGKELALSIYVKRLFNIV